MQDSIALPTNKGPQPRPPEERFWELVNGPWCDPRVGPDDCWIWMGGRCKSRNLRLTPQLIVGANQAALILTGAPRPEGHVAAHSCDVSLCCNFLHLRWAPQSENVRESWARSR